MSLFIANIFLGFSGFLLSTYIAHKKRRKTEHFICPLRGSCSEVVHSNYSRFLGFPVELLGMAYYAVIAIGYGVRGMFPEFDGFLSVPLMFVSTFALLFSFYLTFIQVVTLRKLCTWCLISATLTLCIFLFSFVSSVGTLIPFLSYAAFPISLLHILGLAIGLGASTLADVFFFKFLRDSRISELESEMLHTFSQVIWLAIGIILMTGLGMYLPAFESWKQNPTFLLTCLVMGVVVINGAMLNLFVTPKFLQIQNRLPHEHQEGELVHIRKLVFLLGPISLVSWYTVFILHAFGGRVPASFELMLQIYLSTIFVVGLLGQIISARMGRTIVSS